MAVRALKGGPPELAAEHLEMIQTAVSPLTRSTFRFSLTSAPHCCLKLDFLAPVT